MDAIYDVLLWYTRDHDRASIRLLHQRRSVEYVQEQYRFVEQPDGTVASLDRSQLSGDEPLPSGRRFEIVTLSSQSGSEESARFPVEYKGKIYYPPDGRFWPCNPDGIAKLMRLNRIIAIGKRLYLKKYEDDAPVVPIRNMWYDTVTSGFSANRLFAVQTPSVVVERCILMTTDPGDIVLDPTCGSGTTAFCAEKLGRRWITCDTSRVAMNVARQRLLSATFEHYKTRNGKVSGNFIYKTVNRVTLKSLVRDLEPEKVEMVDQPEVDKDAIRVCGPFEVMSLGRYSVEDWRGYVVREPRIGEAAKLENYIKVICCLYRKDAAIQGASGLVHAVAETEKEKIAISVGPLSGRVTAKQINDAVQDALASGILEVHVLGWAFEANVGEVKSALEKRGKVKVELIMIRPDTLAEGLKATQPEMLFSPLALPDIEVQVRKTGKNGPEATVTLKGVAIFDRKHRRTEYKHADSGYIAAWYLDEDYDGDCFVDCQMFFDFKKKPALSKLGVEVPDEEFALRLTSEPFPVRGYKRIAVKVVDVYGNESTVVRDL
jgi:adenine-specific DNA-methyltransferase